MRKSFGLHGLPGAGKDTIYEMMSERAQVYRLAFGDALKEEVCEAYGVTMEFLNNRKTKETPLYKLAPINCKSPEFVKLLRATYGNEFKIGMPMSPRRITQLWGTEFRRAQDENYWVMRLDEKLQRLPDDAIVCITDVRDPGNIDNESTYVREFLKGPIVHVINPSVKGSAHASDKLIPFKEGDLKIDNDQGLAELAEKVEALMDTLDIPLRRAEPMPVRFAA